MGNVMHTSSVEKVEPAVALDDGVVAEEKREHLKPKGFKKTLKRIVKRARKLNRTHAVFGDRPVLENAAFPWVADIESEWQTIRKELDQVLLDKENLPAFHEVLPDVRTITQDNRWKTYMFCGYGVKSKPNIERCPETWRVLQKIPGMKSAMFSILEPRKHIPAHKGPYNGVLRLHLGLIVPEPRDEIALRVDQHVLHWKQGEAMVFDDAFEHEVWNRTDGLRVVLFVDFVKPLRFPANLINWLVISLAPFTPFIREGVEQQKQWEKRYYAGS